MSTSTTFSYQMHFYNVFVFEIPDSEIPIFTLIDVEDILHIYIVTYVDWSLWAPVPKFSWFTIIPQGCTWFSKIKILLSR